MSTREPRALLKSSFSERGLASAARSSPFEYLSEFREACRELKPGRVAEFDATMINEHRARKYLGILAGEDSSFKALVLRTGTGLDGGRRRVFVLKPRPARLVVETRDDK